VTENNPELEFLATFIKMAVAKLKVKEREDDVPVHFLEITLELHAETDFVQLPE